MALIDKETIRSVLSFRYPTPEQPVEGLEEELENYAKLYPFEDAGSYRNLITLARHFAEWGRKQVLQEIYDGKVKPVDKITAAWLDDEQNI